MKNKYVPYYAIIVIWLLTNFKAIAQNNTCASAGALALGTTTSQNNSGASADQSSPSCYTVKKNVWYTYTTGAVGGSLSIVVTPACGSLGCLLNAALTWPAVAVLSGNCGGFSTSACGTSASAAGSASCTATCLAANTTYYIDVDVLTGSGGTTGYFNITASFTASNDLCSNAISLGTVSTTTTTVGNNSCATADLWVPSCFRNTYQNVWYTFTVPAGGGSYSIAATATGGSPISYPQIAVAQMPTSCSLTGLVEEACGSYHSFSGSSSSTTVNASCLAAGTYYIMVDDDYYDFGSSGTFSLTVTQTSAGGPPANDACASAISLGTVTTTTTTTGTNVCASVDQSSGTCFTGGNGNIWYSFTTGASGGTATFTVSSSSGTMIDPEIAVYSGTCGSFSQLGCARYNVSSTKATLSVGCLAASTTYYIQVDNDNGSTQGTFTLTTTFTAGTGPPSNDACSAPISLGTISTNTTVAGTNVCASADLSGADNYTPNANVWYTFTVPAGGGAYSFSVTTGTMTKPNFTMGLFATNCSTTGISLLANASSNSTSAGTVITDAQTCMAPGTYYIMVDNSSSGTTGTFSLSVKQTSATGPPANDVCSSPVALTTGVGTAGTNVCASIAGTDPTFCNYGFGTAEASVWYQYTLASAGNITLSIAGGTIQYPNISFYTAGTCGTSGSFVGPSACGTPSSTSALSVSFNCLAAGTYYIGVTDDVGNGGNTGTFTITPTFTAGGIPANDNCAGATSLGSVSTNTTITGTNLCATADQSNPSCFNYSANVWYTFTVPATGTYSVTVNAGTITYPALEIYSGSCGSFTSLICTNNHIGNTSVSGVINCLAAGTYYVAVDYDSHNGNGSQGTFSLTVNAVPGCSGTPTGGTASYVLNSSTCGVSNNVTLSLSGNSSSCGISYQWQSSTNGTTWTNIPGATSSTYNATVSSNTYYQCVLTCSNGGATGTSSNVLVSGSTTPSNDNCANAIAITLNNPVVTGSYIGTMAGTNACATADGSISNVSGGNSACFSINQNVWYTFTAPVTGNYFVGVTAGSMVDPMVSILTGTCGSLTEQDCAGMISGNTYDSDAGLNVSCPGSSCSFNSYSPYGFSPFSKFTSGYSLAGICSVNAGTVVHVMVDSYKSSGGGSTGTFTVTVATLVNDNISKPLIINTCGTNFNSSTIGATNCGNGSGDGLYNDIDNSTSSACSGNGASSGGDSYCDGSPGSSGAGSFNSYACINGGDVGYSVENDSWYEFCVTATSTITLTFDPTASTCLPSGSAGLQISVFKGSIGSLTKVGGGYCGMDITGSVVYTYTLAPNACTFIEVDGSAGTNCDYVLNAAILPTCVLSVELLSFTGVNEQGRIKLNWSSTSETNAGKYVVERSADGIDYLPISYVNAKGNTTEKTNYSTYDEHPIQNAINYYRLSEYDVNGKGGALAQTFVSNTGGFPRFTAYPNPSNGNVTISVSNFAVATLAVKIYDVYGRMVWSSDINLDNGAALQHVNLSSFEPGMYFIETNDGTNFYKQSLIIYKNN